MKIYRVDAAPVSIFRDYPSSYTIFGGICWAYRLLYGEDKLNQLLNQYLSENPPFLVSSLLPKTDGNYLFPRPHLKPLRVEDNSLDHKKLKKINYIPLDVLIKVLEGKIKNEYELHRELDKKSVGKSDLYERDIIPHASIDRVTGSTEGSGELFFEEITAVKEFYLLIAIEDEKLEEIKSALSLIQDIGLGGNRSVGYGRVIFGEFKEFSEIKKYFNNQNDRFISLSPFIPEPATYNLSDSFYEIFTFQGAVDNNYSFKKVDIWKDKVLYLKEGSVLKVKTPKRFYGQFYKAKEINEIPIYQYGLAFPLFIQEENR